jgi:hypothetical protein
MRNFGIGLIVGLLLAVAFSYLTSNTSVGGNPTKVDIAEKGDQQAPSIQPEPTKRNVKTNTKAVETKEKRAIETAEIDEPSLETTADEDSKGKRKIIEMLDSFDANDLARIESILTHLNDKTPSERFEIEPVDVNWSLQKQAELEYSFYEKSALKDVGTLESIRCKSQLCEVRVTVPADVNLKPSHYMDWSTPVSTSIHPSQSDPDSKEIVMYLNKP